MSSALLTVTDKVDHWLESRTTTIARDLKMNLKRALGDSSLSPEEGLLTLLAVSTAVGIRELAEYAAHALVESGLTSEQVQEASESAALMAMLNTYYKFRQMIGNDQDYARAGLRMTALAKPALGKERFEMLAFAVSVVNGCESCIRSHERALREAGKNAEQIHDMARLAATVKGISALRVGE